MKLYAELAPSKLLALASRQHDVSMSDVDAVLTKHSRHHARALLLMQRNDVSGALEIWRQLVDGHLQDVTFPGLEHVIDVITWCVRAICLLCYSYFY